MAFNIKNFVSNLRDYGVLQTNRYDVIISPSASLLQSFGNNIQPILNMRADRVKSPGLSLSVYESRRYGVGPIVKSATNVQFNDVDISFIETSNSDIFKIFYKWTNQIVDYRSNKFDVGYKDSISAQVQIRVFNNSGTSDNSNAESPVAVIDLIDAFPISVSDVQLAWSDNNTLYKLDVGFAYTSWRLQDNNLDGRIVREDLPPLPGVAAENYNPNRESDRLARTLDTLRTLQQFR